MPHILFGSENAETDDLLDDCFVSLVTNVSERPILTGRWGTGKTALILSSNLILSNALRDAGANDRIWYLDEKTLNREALLELKGRFSDNRALRAALEDIWRAEILRIEAILLTSLHSKYSSPRGDHWDKVIKVGKQSSLTHPIWKQLGNVAKLVFGSENQRVEGFQGVTDAVRALFNDTLFHAIQQCLKDIEDDPIQPVVAIEPLETPTSAIEQEKGLAQLLITSLLNVFRDTFEPSSRQRVQLRISIPWHRFIKEELDFPQKLYQYVSSASWTAGKLRNFINRRIEWEFRRAGRHFTAKGSNDAWAVLFEEMIKNDHCTSGIREDSFKYILRHTHRRPRDLQRLVRETVEYHVRSGQTSLDEFLLGRSGAKVSEKSIREAVRRTCRGSAEDRITEGGRRFIGFRTIVEALRGLRTPFTTDDLKKRLENLAAKEKQEYPIRPTLDLLWRGGIVGVEITPLDADAAKHLEAAVGTRALRRYVVDGKEIEKRFFFEYNWEGDPFELLERATPGEIETALVLHPVTFEYLFPTLTRSYPIGA